LVVRSNGSPDLVGRPAVVSESAAGMAYAGYLIRLRPKTTEVLPKFLAFMLQSPQLRKKIEAEARSTSGVHNVNAHELAALQIPDFDVPAQAKVVKQIETAFAWLDRMSAHHASASKLLPKLDAAILAQAFRGELTPQDPNDEPAEALLARVREARAAEGQKARQRATKVRAMNRDPKEILLRDSQDWPAKGLPFEEIAKRVALPYDEMRDAMFTLLGGEAPRLRQVFDKDAGCMHLRRVS